MTLAANCDGVSGVPLVNHSCVGFQSDSKLTERILINFAVFDDDHEVALWVCQHLDVVRGVAVDQAA